MGERILLSLLLDFYGALLTERQRECLVYHHEEDCSFSEIAEELHISRQAVHDTMRRAVELLTMYEERLHLVAQHEARKALLASMKEELGHEVIDRERLMHLVTELEG